MANLITREQTKRLVRSLDKVVEKGNTGKLYLLSLYYLGDRKFKWCEEGEKQGGDLFIQMKKVYVSDGKGNYKRKNLGELDKYFYQAINGSKYAKMVEFVKMFDKKVLEKTRKRLKYLDVFIINEDGEYVLTSNYYYTKSSPKPKEEGYQNLDGYGMEDAFIDYMYKRNKRHEGLTVDSESGMMVVKVGSNRGLKDWEGFLSSVESFDQFLDGR